MNPSTESIVRSNLCPIPSDISPNKRKKFINPLPSLYSSVISLKLFKELHESAIVAFKSANTLPSLVSLPPPILIPFPLNRLARPLAKLATSPSKVPITGITALVANTTIREATNNTFVRTLARNSKIVTKALDSELRGMKYSIISPIAPVIVVMHSTTSPNTENTTLRIGRITLIRSSVIVFLVLLRTINSPLNVLLNPSIAVSLNLKLEDNSFNICENSRSKFKKKLPSGIASRTPS